MAGITDIRFLTRPVRGYAEGDLVGERGQTLGEGYTKEEKDNIFKAIGRTETFKNILGKTGEYFSGTTKAETPFDQWKWRQIAKLYDLAQIDKGDWSGKTIEEIQNLPEGEKSLKALQAYPALAVKGLQKATGFLFPESSEEAARDLGSGKEVTRGQYAQALLPMLEFVPGLGFVPVGKLAKLGLKFTKDAASNVKMINAYKMDLAKGDMTLGDIFNKIEPTSVGAAVTKIPDTTDMNILNKESSITGEYVSGVGPTRKNPKLDLKNIIANKQAIKTAKESPELISLAKEIANFPKLSNFSIQRENLVLQYMNFAKNADSSSLIALRELVGSAPLHKIGKKLNQMRTYNKKALSAGLDLRYPTFKDFDEATKYKIEQANRNFPGSKYTKKEEGILQAYENLQAYKLAYPDSFGRELSGTQLAEVMAGNFINPKTGKVFKNYDAKFENFLMPDTGIKKSSNQANEYLYSIRPYLEEIGLPNAGATGGKINITEGMTGKELLKELNLEKFPKKYDYIGNVLTTPQREKYALLKKNFDREFREMGGTTDIARQFLQSNVNRMIKFSLKKDIPVEKIIKKFDTIDTKKLNEIFLQKENLNKIRNNLGMDILESGHIVAAADDLLLSLDVKNIILQPKIINKKENILRNRIKKIKNSNNPKDIEELKQIRKQMEDEGIYSSIDGEIFGKHFDVIKDTRKQISDKLGIDIEDLNYSNVEKEVQKRIHEVTNLNQGGMVGINQLTRRIGNF